MLGRKLEMPYVALILVLFVNAEVDAVVAQPRRIAIPYAIACAVCSVSLEKVAVLRRPNDSLSIEGASVARDSRGRYLTIGTASFSILVFDSTGGFLSSFGRKGEGPGEFDQPLLRLQVARGDSVYAIERAGRISVFSPTLRYVRSFKVPRPLLGGISVLRTGVVVLGAQLSSPQSVGLPFHTIAVDGQVIRSFGADSVRVPARGQAVVTNRFEMSIDDRVLWTWPMVGPYRLDGWDLDGNGHTIVEIGKAPWWVIGQQIPFTPEEQKALQDAMRERRPLPEIKDRSRPGSGVSIGGVDRAGRLWVFGSSPSVSGGTGKGVLEIIDVANRRIVLSQEVSASFELLDNGSWASTRHVGADGSVSYTVWRVKTIGF